MAKRVTIIAMKKGEGKWITFTVYQTVNGERQIMPLTGKEFKFAAKEKAADTTYVIEKSHSDFDIADAANGVVRVKITATESDALDTRSYEAELKIIMDPPTNSEIDKSIDVQLKINPAVIHD